MLNNSIWKYTRTLSSSIKTFTQPTKFSQFSRNSLRHFSINAKESEQNLKLTMLKNLDKNKKKRELYMLHYSFPKNEEIYYNLIRN